MLGYVKTSLKNLLSKSYLSIILLILVQLFAVIVIVFSYGIVNHYNTKVDEVEGVSLLYEFNRSDEAYDNDIYMNIHQTKKVFKEILPMLENKLDYFFVSGWSDDKLLLCSTDYKNGRYTLSSQLLNKTGIRDGGSMFTEEEVANGEKCVLIADEMNDGSGYIMLNGEKYKVKGIMANEAMSFEFYVPYGAIPENTSIIQLSLILEKPLLESEYKIIAESLEKYMGDTVKIPEFDGVMNESNNRVYRDIIVVSVALIFVFAIDYCIIYRYILEKRRRIFAVSRICGGSKLKISIAYMIELLGLSFITLVAGIYIFHTFVLQKSVEWFEYINIYCNIEAYKRLGMIYMAVLFAAYLVLVMRFVKKTPVSLIKEV